MSTPTTPIDLRTERMRRGMSAKAMAVEIGVSEDVLLGAERGARPQPANAYKIAKFFDVDVIDQWPLPPSDREAA